MHTPEGFTPSHALPAALPADTLAFAFRDGRILVGGTEDAPVVPVVAQLERLGLRGDRHYLGELGRTGCVAVHLPDDAREPEGWRYAGLRALFFRLPEPILAIAARAFQVVEWDRTHRYCGRCGTPTRDKTGERAKECPACGYAAYPRVTPAMMVLVTRGRELLLARAPRFPPGMFSALAGFVEPGETIEDCIHREVREEVGIEVGSIRYFASQSWAFPHSLMIAYTAEYAGGELQPDATEIAEARWFAWDAVPALPPSISISRRLIEATVARLARDDARPC
ncbi:MAG: NAD(+) diphosphatase [Betaproteobacteria bacterium]|nr:NAD(+) diphosphatase [Betaproteobacteria bacterium]